MRDVLMSGSKNPVDIFKTLRYRVHEAKAHPTEFKCTGIRIFCGSQGSGKTLSAVQYIKKVCAAYPKCILVTNTDISGLPETTRVIEYDGIDCLKNVCNGIEGVVYFIDEIHLELNSLESKNIDIDTMVELSQQRKQRKHIVGTSQVYMRMAKPLREQVKDIILCKNYFGLVQFNTHINGFESYEEGGKLVSSVIGKYLWFHRPELYSCYDTYAKMRRYSKEWNGRKRDAGGY